MKLDIDIFFGENEDFLLYEVTDYREKLQVSSGPLLKIELYYKPGFQNN